MPTLAEVLDMLSNHLVAGRKKEFNLNFHPIESWLQVNANKAFKYCVENGFSLLLRRLLHTLDIDPAQDNQFALLQAVRNSDVEVIRVLLDHPKIDGGANQGEALALAKTINNQQVIELLIVPTLGAAFTADDLDAINTLLFEYKPFLDANTHDVFLCAISHGYLLFTQFINDNYHLDLSFEDNLPLKMACMKGHADIVRYLLSDPAVDPSAEESCALRWAARGGHETVVDILLADGRSDVRAQQNYAIRLAWFTDNMEVYYKLVYELIRRDMDDKRKRNLELELQGLEIQEAIDVSAPTENKASEETKSPNSPSMSKRPHKPAPTL